MPNIRGMIDLLSYTTIHDAMTMTQTPIATTAVLSGLALLSLFLLARHRHNRRTLSKHGSDSQPQNSSDPSHQLRSDPPQQRHSDSPPKRRSDSPPERSSDSPPKRGEGSIGPNGLHRMAGGNPAGEPCPSIQRAGRCKSKWCSWRHPPPQSAVADDTASPDDPSAAPAFTAGGQASRFFAERDATSGLLPMDLRLVDAFLRSDSGVECLRHGLFPNAQEISESMACLAAVTERLRGVVTLGSPRTLAVVVGDGRTPRTAALLALRAPSWRVVSIDPALHGLTTAAAGGDNDDAEEEGVSDGDGKNDNDGRGNCGGGGSSTAHRTNQWVENLEGNAGHGQQHAVSDVLTRQMTSGELATLMGGGLEGNVEIYIQMELCHAHSLAERLRLGAVKTVL